MKANFSGPFVNVSIKISIDFLSRLSMMQSSTYTRTMMSDELSMKFLIQMLLVLAILVSFTFGLASSLLEMNAPPFDRFLRPNVSLLVN